MTWSSDAVRWWLYYEAAAAVFLLVLGAVVVARRRRAHHRRARRPRQARAARSQPITAPAPGVREHTATHTGTSRPTSAGLAVVSDHRGGPAGAAALSSGHAGVVSDVVTVPGVRALAASVVGREHLARALSREDAYATYQLLDSGTAGACFAVADGVSGTPRSQTYALALAMAAVHALAQEWSPSGGAPPDILERIAHRSTVRESEVLQALGSSSVPPKSHQRVGAPAATLALVAARPSASGLHVSWWQVGDARIGVLNPHARTLNWISGSGGGDGHVTYAMPRDVAHAVSGSRHVTGGQWIVLASDGAVPVLETHLEAALDIVTRAGDELATLTELTALLGAQIEGDHDDRTLVLLTADSPA